MKPTAAPRRSRGHMLAALASAIAAALIVWWLFSPVVHAIDRRLQQLGNALEAKP